MIRTSVKRLARSAVFTALRASLIPTILREIVYRRRVTIILYHDIRPALAARHLPALKARYNIVSLRRVVTASREGRMRELPPKALVITLDDGHRGNRDLLPVLEGLEVPVTMFLCSQIVDTRRGFWFLHAAAAGRIDELKSVPDSERRRRLRDGGFEHDTEWPERQALDASEIRAMNGVVDFQSHTRFHPVIPRCDETTAWRELAESKAEVEALTGSPVYAISYPNGYYSERDIALSRRAGYECGITVDAGTNDARTDPFRLKRICIDDGDSVSAMLVKSTGLWSLLKNAIRGQGYGQVEPHVGA